MPIPTSLLFYKKYDENPAILSVDGMIVGFNEVKKNIQLISQKLQAVGSKTGDKVAILCHGGNKTLEIILALASNFICVPINAALKDSEIEKIISDLKIQTIVLPPETDRILKLKKGELSILKFFIPNNKKSLEIKILSTKKTFQNEKNDKTAAFIIVTSGTTAEPKFITLSRKNIIANAVNMKKTLRLKSTDRCLDVMPFFHVHGLMVAITTLAAGGSVICPPKFDQNNFFKWWQTNKPTWYTASPTIHQSILRIANDYKKIIVENPIRMIRSSSAPLAPQIIRMLEEAFRAPVLESYGMTEATLQITSNLLPPGQRKTGSAGKPIGLRLAIINRNNQFLKKNQIGEIIIKGANIIKKYTDESKTNKNSFYQGWLKTGDFGYLDNDGYLYIIGRIKEMINKGGENISPREIDEFFLKHPKVNLAAAFAIPHKTLGEDIAVAIILKKNEKAGEGELKKYALKNLSEFKVPSKILIVKDLPKTSTGKIQRLKLYEKFKKRLSRKTFSIKKYSPKNILAIDLWKKLLEIKDALLEDNFFEAGGDSLLLEQLITELKKNGQNIDKNRFLKEPRLKTLLKK